MSIGEYYKILNTFYTECVLWYDSVPQKTGFDDILVVGKHHRWISFRDWIRNSEGEMLDIIVEYVEGSAAGKKILNKILMIYVEILKFIEYHKASPQDSDCSVEYGNRTTRDVTVEEVEEVLKSSLSSISEVYEEIPAEILKDYDQIFNHNLLAERNPIHEAFNTEAFYECMQKMIDKGIVEKTEEGFIWKNSKKLYGYFVEKSSIVFKLRRQKSKIPWRLYASCFTNHRRLESSARCSVGSWLNDGASKPEGYETINSILGI